jgi:carboxylesterase
LAWSGYNVYPTTALGQLVSLQKKAQAELGKVTQPILIVMSKQDRSVPLTVADQLKAQLKSKDKEFVILEDSPHVILLANRQKEAQDAAWRFLSARI